MSKVEREVSTKERNRCNDSASKWGWGAAYQSHGTGGPWSQQERIMHINCLELLAATLAVQTFAKRKTNISILLRIDNTTAVAYINHLGWVGVKGAHPPRPQFMDVVPGKEHSLNSSASPRGVKPHSRCGVSDISGSVRLEAEPIHLSEDKSPLRSNRHRSICLQANNTVCSLFQLAARSLCTGNRCISSRLVSNQGLCKPSMGTHWQGIVSGPNPKSLSRPCSSNMEIPTLVPCVAGDVNRLSPSNSNPSTGDDQSTPITSSTPPGHMAYLRQRYSGFNLSEEAIAIMLKSWQCKTNRSYDSLFRSWCSKQGSNPVSGPINDFINFLASLFKEGYQYNSIDAYRSAISSVHEQVDGVDVGKHPLVMRALKGMFHDRPPLPRYTSTWNVDLVLNRLLSWGPNNSLSLKKIT